jgi:hypothetical protein
MTVYYSVRILTNLVCDCQAYKYPHAAGKNLCCVPLPDLDSVLVKASSATLRKAKCLVRDGYL